MNYEKEYKAALGRARNLHKDAIDIEDSLRAKMAEIIFPELKESEDERVKRILHSILSKMSFHLRDIFTEEEFQCFDAWSYAWLEKQETSYTGKDVDDAYLKGVNDTKNEIERQYEANYQIRKDIATFIFNYRGDIKDRTKWINYLGIKVSFTESKQGGMSNKNDERLRKTTISFLEDFANKGYEDAVECIDWLEKQSESDETKAKTFLINKGYPIDANGTFPTYEEMCDIIKEGLEKQGEQKTQGKSALEAIEEEKEEEEKNEN